MKVADMWQRILEFVRPYTFEDYIKEYGPKDHKELEDLEKRWLTSSNWFNRSQ
jgi:hypothetical protein